MKALLRLLTGPLIRRLRRRGELLDAHDRARRAAGSCFGGYSGPVDTHRLGNLMKGGATDDLR